jgi:glycosyltransferase involved in cell wall biosynthesis
VSGRPKNRLRISVVVPAWNDQENLAALLPMLANLDLHEIIVVDASNDGSRALSPGSQVQI